jgi:hypothetical protein
MASEKNSAGNRIPDSRRFSLQARRSASCRLRVEPIRDFFEQSSGGLTGMAGGKFTAQFNHRESGAHVGHIFC